MKKERTECYAKRDESVIGWVFSLGEQVKIVSPEEVAEQMRAEAKRLIAQYGE